MNGQKALPANTLRPESKVTASTLATYLVSVGVLAVAQAAGQLDVASFLPAGWAQVLLVPVVPGIIAAVAGWAAPHTRRIGREPLAPNQE